MRSTGSDDPQDQHQGHGIAATRRFFRSTTAYLRHAALATAAALLAACASTPPPAPDAASAAASAASAASAVAASAPAVAAASAPAEGASAADADGSASVQIPSPAAAASAAGATITAPANAEPSEPTEATGTPTDPLQPQEPVEVRPEVVHQDLWDRLRKGFAMPDLDGPLVHRSEQWYAQRPDYVQRMCDRSSRYLFHILKEVERRGMPTELALLPFIESAFNPQALSSAKASGMWQFIPSTGRHYELTQNLFRDERRDVLASTRAALDHLQKLHDMFDGDWQLALAAYNWGEGNVIRAIARNRRAHKPTDYSSLKMPAETRMYVPKLQAVKNIVAHPEAFGLTLPPIENHPYFLSVPIQRDMDVELIAQLADLPMEEFQALNPSLKQPVILAAGTPQVLLPYDNADAFVNALAEHDGPLASWTAWVVPRTMTPAQAAHEVGMSEAALRDVNNIPPRMKVKAGSTLLVPRARGRTTDVSERIADSATILLQPESPQYRRHTIKARRHDSVTAIAKRYRVSASSVARWNKCSASKHFKTGEIVVLYLPTKSRARSTAKAASHRAQARSSKKASRHRAHASSKSKHRSAVAKKKSSHRSTAAAKSKSSHRTAGGATGSHSADRSR